MKRLVRFITLAATVAAVVAAIRSLTRQDDPLPSPAGGPTGEPWTPLRPEPVVAPEPDGVPVAGEPTPAPTPVSGASWAEPTAEGDCPDGYPIKAKLKSKIFHAPGQLNYDRTTPDRCYVDAAAAEADGLRAAKR